MGLADKRGTLPIDKEAVDLCLQAATSPIQQPSITKTLSYWVNSVPDSETWDMPSPSPVGSPRVHPNDGEFVMATRYDAEYCTYY